jgi:hypothetical protein
MNRTITRTAALAALTALALGAAACGDDEPDNEGGRVETGSEAPHVLSFTVTEQGKKTTLTPPTDAKSGVAKISLKNQGKKPHEAQIVRIEGDQTAEEVLKVIMSDDGKIPEWIQDGGGVGTTAPGKTNEVIQELAPGRYVVFDAENEGSAEFEVAEEKGSDAEFPETEASVTAEDYSFKTSGLKAGDNVITFENTGEELHHAGIVPLMPGVKFAEAKKFLKSDEEPKGKPPVDFNGSAFTAVIDGGIKQVTRLELKAGTYAFVCFIPDRDGGPPHAIGEDMITEVTVK